MATIELLGKVPLLVMDLEATCDEGDGLSTNDMKAFFGGPRLSSSSPKLYLPVRPARAGIFLLWFGRKAKSHAIYGIEFLRELLSVIPTHLFYRTRRPVLVTSI